MISNSSRLSLAGFSLGALLVASCGGGGGGGDSTTLTIFTSDLAIAGTTPVAFSGEWIAFLADEATSENAMPTPQRLNLDNDGIDSVAIVVQAGSDLQTNLQVAALDLAWLGEDLFLIVDEAADDLDWSGDGPLDDRVLLHWSETAGAVTWVDDVSTAGSIGMVVAGDTLFYSAATVPAGVAATSLMAIASGAPLLPNIVYYESVGGPAEPVILGQDEGLVFLAFDEGTEAADLNGDGVDGDLVLALLDGLGLTAAGDYTLMIRSTELALPPADLPLRALAGGPHDWQVGFLVSELRQDQTNYNVVGAGTGLPPTWQPTQCNGFEDSDFLDNVLFYLHFADWDFDPVANPPVNTGLVGTKRIVMVDGYVGTISPESMQGTCFLNGDDDQTDEIFRWVATTTPVLPVGNPASLFAIADLPGGVHGIGELSGAFTITIDEAEDERDSNNDGTEELNLIAWLDPSAGSVWNIDQEAGPGEEYAEGSWVGQTPDRSRLLVAFTENTYLVDLNGDMDTLDSIGTFAHFVGSPRELAFPGFAAASETGNAGLVYRNGWGYFRVSELEDNRDWTNDGDLNDFALFRSRLSDGLTQSLTWCNSLPNSPVILVADTATVEAGLLISDESIAGDLNADGDTTDLVPRWFGL